MAMQLYSTSFRLSEGNYDRVVTRISLRRPSVHVSDELAEEFETMIAERLASAEYANLDNDEAMLLAKSIMD